MFASLQRKAIEGGALGPSFNLVWPLQNQCEAPYELRFQPSRSLTEGVVTLITPCRNCKPCLKRRARFWAAKAAREWLKSPKTWFGTFTFGPAARSQLRAAISGLQTPEERVPALVKAGGERVTKYLKVLRKQGVELRYLLTPELHKDGMVHFHALLHTQATWRQLDKWDHGFLKLNIVHDGVKEIRYVTKYLAKAKLGRVRASLSYGVRPPDIGSEGERGDLYAIQQKNGLTGSSVRWVNALLTMLHEHGYTVDLGESGLVISELVEAGGFAEALSSDSPVACDVECGPSEPS